MNVRALVGQLFRKEPAGDGFLKFHFRDDRGERSVDAEVGYLALLVATPVNPVQLVKDVLKARPGRDNTDADAAATQLAAAAVHAFGLRPESAVGKGDGMTVGDRAGLVIAFLAFLADKIDRPDLNVTAEADTAPADDRQILAVSQVLSRAG